MARQHSVVVGAGMIGLNTALRLAQKGERVTVVDRGGPASGTSGTTGGLVGSNEKQPWEYFVLGMKSMEAMERLARELDSGRWYLPNGHLEWANSEGSQRALNERVARLTEWGYPLERMDPRRVERELEPDLRIPADVESVTFFSADSIVYPHILLAYVVRELRALGVEFRLGTGDVGLAVDGSAACGVRTAAGEVIDADRVIACTGRWTDDFLAPTGLSLSLVNPWSETPETLGLQVITTGVAADVRRMVRMPGLSIRPAGGGRLMLHGRPEEEELHAAGPDGSGLTWDTPLDSIPSQAYSLVEKARGVMRNLESVTVQSATASVRPLTGDGLPVIGFVPGVDNLYVAVTHSGIGLGPLLGELIAGEVVDQSDSELLRMFRPERFATDAWKSEPHPMRGPHARNAPIN